jgi:hypothetical protein
MFAENVFAYSHCIVAWSKLVNLPRPEQIHMNQTIKQLEETSRGCLQKKKMEEQLKKVTSGRGAHTPAYVNF